MDFSKWETQSKYYIKLEWPTDEYSDRHLRQRLTGRNVPGTGSGVGKPEVQLIELMCHRQTKVKIFKICLLETPQHFWKVLPQELNRWISEKTFQMLQRKGKETFWNIIDPYHEGTKETKILHFQKSGIYLWLSKLISYSLLLTGNLTNNIKCH